MSLMAKSLRKRAQNSSDGNAVLEAGWGAMQAADPKLAAAVQQMPPQVAQGVILQYTNAIRLGNEAEASTMASQFARDALTAYSQQPSPAAGAPGTQMSRIAKRLSGKFGNGVPAPVKDAAWFDGLMTAEQAPAPQQPKGLARIAARLGSLNMAAGKAPDHSAAFQKVKDSYNSYNQAGMTEYDKSLLWSQPAPKEIKVADNWWEQKNAQLQADQNQLTGGGF